MSRDGIFNKLGEERRNEDDNDEQTHGLFFYEKGRDFKKVGEPRRNEDDDAK